ncbi:hypothetical protein BHF70_03975 [Anaerostipes sp. 494a]|uniref:DUF2953 domain-containing protein n=1 Tax=Anaerostipes TaxID=207244 RepID=UPI0009517FBA|nr:MULTISPECIES: DUF2953 domain-containing protein [Anaerostipes]MCI5622679.1 DUF2953 domain-containing protein [Anaerostipes sp.]MDY2725751.1 DUF2953 domain-containing protein [Anaerostipes faecalis]OLR58848.1 hypothetical protein BHF70_03975 [Anaerostipes sp. 494a]
MSIIFLILKILGIILLIPVILLLILFICPICYRLEGEFDGENPKIKGRVSWALFFLRIKGWYEEQPGIIVRIFGLPVYRTDGKWAILGRNDKKKPVIVNEVSAPQNKEKKSQKDISEKIAHHISRETENSVQKSQSPVEDILDLPWDEEFEEENDSKELIKKENEKKKKFIGKRIVRFIKTWYHKCKVFIRKLQDGLDKIYTMKEFFFEDKEIRLALSRVKKYGTDGIRYLLPQKVKGVLKFGLDDPAETGKVLGYLAVLIPLYEDHLEITPDFTQSILKGHLLISGRIRKYKLLKLAWIVFRDKDLLKQKDRVVEMIGG